MNLSKSIASALIATCMVVVWHAHAQAQANYPAAPGARNINPLANDPVEPNSRQTPRQQLPSAVPGSGPELIIGDKPPEGGWDGLAKILDAIAPGIDTKIPLSPAEISQRIEGLIRTGRLKEALDAVEKRQAVEANRHTPGTDVQLMFLHARLLTELKRLPEAEAIYQRMTMRFPELPEPWNNLADLYVKRDELEQARRALEMSIMINPNSAMAQANFGDVQLLLALRAYEQALKAGAIDLRPRIRSVTDIIESINK